MGIQTEMMISEYEQRIVELEAEMRIKDENIRLLNNVANKARKEKAEAQAENARLKDRLNISQDQDTGIYHDEIDMLQSSLYASQAENERLREMSEHLVNSDSVACLQDAERYRKCIKFNWLHPDYDPTGHAWEGE